VKSGRDNLAERFAVTNALVSSYEFIAPDGVVAMQAVTNTICLGDCIEGMDRLPPGRVDLVFADPPFNIGYDYDVYNDSLEYRQYLEWSSRWISSVRRVLKPTGTFWLAIGDEFAAELKVESRKLGFHCRSWVIWYYTFGVHCSKKFTRSHAHLFQFVKDPNNFTFRDEEVRVPSARELVYNDKRANPAGRMPDDTWIIRPAGLVGEMVADDDETWSPELIEPPSDDDRTFILRPQDVGEGFQPSEDTWYFPRVAGTFKERTGFHGCQMPEQLLGRIIRACSNPGDLVLDPFSGSATTLAVAKKLGRRFIGFDVSKSYVEFGSTRLNAIRVGDPLDGSPEPLKSAPKTTRGRTKLHTSENKRHDPGRQRDCDREAHHDLLHRELTQFGVVEAFRRSHDGFSADRVVADPELDREFVSACEHLGLVGDARTWNTLLFRMRKAGQLSRIATRNRTTISWEECDQYVFASEIALQRLLNLEIAQSLDDILCDPALATEFDRESEGLAPGFRPFDYRWAALRLRKEAKKARHRANRLEAPRRFGDRFPVEEVGRKSLPESPGLYLVGNQRRKLYVGETLNLRNRLVFQFGHDQLKTWMGLLPRLSVQTLPMDHSKAGQFAWQSCLIKKHKPSLNYFELRSAS
jgi:site-specific DNA-methyltransferase (adenine-specific)